MYHKALSDLKHGFARDFPWGVSTDLPVTGNWNGDGRTEMEVFRNSTHIFYQINGTITTTKILQ
jgi:hypothetical protein